MAWTSERISELLKLNGEGFSASLIAERLGDVTRNGVIGKLHRLNVVMSQSQGIRPKFRKPRTETENFFRGPARPNKNHPPKFHPLVLRIIPMPAPEPATGGVTFADLEPHQCRFPLGAHHDKPERFCGAPVIKRPIHGGRRCPYCEYHYAVAYNKQPRHRDPAPLNWILRRAA